MTPKRVSQKTLRVDKAARVLRAGGVVVYPTDTAYALGCDATDVAAVRRIFKIKGREKGKPLPMIVADMKMVKKYFRISNPESRISKRYWPGPLSIILPVRGKMIAKSALYKGTAAVRVPDSVIARDLSRRVGAPLIATSANVSGKPAAYSIKSLSLPRRGAGGEVFVIDAGVLRRRKPSTIVKIERNKIVVLRKGPIRL
jgi:L-threonylcarbamoyladenylate synthase